jgi:hypothetical protein
MVLTTVVEMGLDKKVSESVKSFIFFMALIPEDFFSKYGQYMTLPSKKLINFDSKSFVT